MPLPSRLRSALLAACASVVVVALAACSTDRLPTERPTAVVAVQQAEHDPTGARLIDDARSATLTVVPKRGNGALVVFLHGWGQTRRSLVTRPKLTAVAQALTGAGYTLLSADAKGKAWGDAASIADYRAVIEAAQQRYGLREVFLMGESMGGLATMQLGRTLPQVRAVVAWYPVCDLRTMKETRFQATIASAWQGVSRAPVSPVAAGSKPMLIWASTGDTVVVAGTNAAVCAAEARRAGADVTWYRSRGDHGDPSNFVPSAVLRFFDQHRSPSA